MASIVRESLPHPETTRLLSLDAFRGFDIAAMLIVNMTWNKSVFPGQLFHVPWSDPLQGATFADLIFPWFVFIAGAAIPFSLDSARRRGRSKRQILLSAARRGATLYLLGVLLTVASTAYTTPLQLSDLLRWNILQLIGAAYFIAVGVALLPWGYRVGFVVFVLVTKWAIMTMLPWETVNSLVATRAVDGAQLGPGTWAHFDAVKRVVGFEHGPEGFVSGFLSWLGMADEFLPCAAIAVIGGITTLTLNAGRNWRQVGKLAGWGVVLVAVAIVLQWNYQATGGGLWGHHTVPFSKWFFSPAYCLLAMGTGIWLFMAFFVAIDLKRWTTGIGLRILGMNAIALYVGAELSFKTIFSKWQIALPGGGTDSLAGGLIAWVEYATGSPLFAGTSLVLVWLVGWWVVCWWLFRRGIFLSV